MNDYFEKLKDPRWQKKRLEIMSRDNWTCLSCGKQKDTTLHVHHSVYIKGLEPWEYGQSLIMLCEQCHEERHHIQKSLLIATSRMTNPELFELAEQFRLKYGLKTKSEKEQEQSAA